MKTSEKIIEISKALLAIQKEIGKVKKTAENPFYHSSYATLDDIIDAVKPVCNKHGVTVLQDINGNVVSTILIHESGEWIQQEGMELPIEKNTAQGAGSAITYGRRYTLSAMLGLASEDDDDGNMTGKSETGKSETAQPKKWAIDFSNIQKELSEIEDMQILKEYHTELMAKEMSDKQKYRINEMFAERKKEIGVIQKIKTEVQGTIVE